MISCLWLNSIASCIYSTFFLTINLLMDLGTTLFKQCHMTELNLGHAQQGLEHLGGCFRILPTTSAHLTSLQGPAVDNLFAVAHHSCLPSLVTTFSLIYGKVLVTVQLYSKQLKTYGRAYTVILGYFFLRKQGLYL